MKRIIIVAFVLLSLCFITSCGHPTESTTTTTAKVGKNVYEQFEEYLSGKGYAIDKYRMAAEYIGAEYGVKYTLPDGKIEVYEFDTGKQSYKDALATQKFETDYGTINATVVNGYAFITENETVKDAFVAIVK